MISKSYEAICEPRKDFKTMKINSALFKPIHSKTEILIEWIWIVSQDFELSFLQIAVFLPSFDEPTPRRPQRIEPSVLPFGTVSIRHPFAAYRH